MPSSVDQRAPYKLGAIVAVVEEAHVDGKRPPRLLLEGRPGIGKTTVARRLLALLRDAGIPLGGFVTDEIRRGGHREGFAVQTVAGQRGVLAHVELPGPPRVGRYGVDLPAFERVALPAMAAPQPVGVVVVVVDELGRMELASAAFRDAMSDLLDREVAVVATVHVHRHPFTDALKRRPDLRVIPVTERSRDALPERLAAELVAAGAARRRQ
ncbi:MAG TPA: nucleoside-triphosphatase [Actinomycetes bacterium]|nr:nucleoside-triphosphatase [Actinomycetes bacterium]